MKKNSVKYTLFFLLSLFLLEAEAQSTTTNTLYFMENVAHRQIMNPAFQPQSKVFVSLPVFGFTQFGVGNNSLTFRDVLSKQGGESVFFYSPGGDKNRFFNALRTNTNFESSLRTNLLSIGIRGKNADYWTFSAVLRQETKLIFPKSFAAFALYGTKDPYKNNFDLTNLEGDGMIFTDISLAYSKQLNEKWSVGARASFLLGHGHASIDNSRLMLDASIDEWSVDAKGRIRASAPGLEIGANLQSMKFNENDALKNPIIGYGAAISLGAAYKALERLTLSAALNDLGTIRWAGVNARTMDYEMKFVTDGVNVSDGSEEAMKKLWKEAKAEMKTKENSDPYFAALSPRMNLGAEYALCKSLSLGLLSSTQLYKNNLYTDLTASANTRATNWLDFSLSYSLLHGRGSSIGAGIALRAGIAQFLIAADYVPLSYAKINMPNTNKAQLVPYNTKNVNVSFGVNLVFGNKKDKDKDGVADKFDLCPETPKGVRVDKQGCPVDSDGDGVPDYLDKCLDTPTASANLVDANGCPLDSDGDGVPDYLDQCPDTQEEARGLVNENGCPADSDGDGIADYLDRCPDTAPEVGSMVDENGCPADSDGDGVADYLDKCPNTPVQARNYVDAEGCLLDSDGDGVPDYLDACPQVKGIKENNGCPEIKKEVKRLFQKALQGIQFETGKATIRKSSHDILNQIVKVLVDNPEYSVEIQGHTDNTGSASRNLELSGQRADSVRKYLESKGVAESRMTSKGFGITKPVADNKTVEGRAKNRRVEFVISFEKMVTE